MRRGAKEAPRPETPQEQLDTIKTVTLGRAERPSQEAPQEQLDTILMVIISAQRAATEDAQATEKADYPALQAE